MLALVWMGGSREKLITALIRVWWVAAAVLGLGILVDGPQPWRWAPDFDRFSVAHFTFFTLGGLFWALVRLKVPATRAKRVLVVLTGAVLGGALLTILFPGIEGGPFSRIHPDLVPLWLDHVSEFAPAGQLGAGPWGLVSVVPGALGLAIVGLGFVRGGLGGVALRSRGAGWKWGVMALCVAWFLALSALGQVRWMQYLQILTPFGMAALLGLVIQRLNRMTAPSLLRAGGMVGVVTLFFFLPPFVLGFLGGRGEQDGRADPCSPASLVPRAQEGDGSRGEERQGAGSGLLGSRTSFQDRRGCGGRAISPECSRDAGQSWDHDIQFSRRCSQGASGEGDRLCRPLCGRELDPQGPTRCFRNLLQHTCGGSSSPVVTENSLGGDRGGVQALSGAGWVGHRLENAGRSTS